MLRLVRPLALLALMLTSAIFGFFYAWVCSTMWGLDEADPRVAIRAMQAMNGSVRNQVFAPAFFGTPLVLALTGVACWLARCRGPAIALFAAAILYFSGGLLLTVNINVPMNEALARVVVPDDLAVATTLWREYSGTWQFWNQVRTVISGVALLLCGWALLELPGSPPAAPAAAPAQPLSPAKAPAQAPSPAAPAT